MLIHSNKKKQYLSVSLSLVFLVIAVFALRSEDPKFLLGVFLGYVLVGFITSFIVAFICWVFSKNRKAKKVSSFVWWIAPFIAFLMMASKFI